ncbi:MAG: hypothetical protein H0W50_10830 [Parachlamydiaceae bacterium]|nr:hypothetical protein [Parachlamydiaceae bacterium]
MFQILNGSLPWTPLALMSTGEVKNHVDSLKNKYVWQNTLFPFEQNLMLNLVELTRGLLIHDKTRRFSCKKISEDLGIVLKSINYA